MRRSNLFSGPILWSDRPMLSARNGVGWAHATPGGGPVLREEASWRTVSGIWINTSRGAAWLFFRRWPR